MSKRKDDQMADVFRALGHPVRVQIVRMLNDDGAAYAGDIVSRLPVVASTASQHLKILREAGLISDAADDNLYLAARNIPQVAVCDAASADPVSLIGFEKVIVTANALKQLEERLA